MPYRAAARSILELVADRAGVLARREGAMRAGLTIVTYHRVLPDRLARAHPLPQLVTPESVFNGELGALAARYRVVELREGLRLLASGDALERGNGAAVRPLVAITFDDGFADNCAVAAPLLRERAMVATFFIVSGLTDTDGELWFEIAARRWLAATDAERRRAFDAARGHGRPGLPAYLSALKSRSPAERDAVISQLRETGRPMAERPLDRAMTTSQLRSLLDDGHEIGGHSVTHPILTTLEETEIRAEVAGCRRDLELRLGVPVTKFCYPNGSLDERVVKATREAGYAVACTTRTGRNAPGADPLLLQRVDAAPHRVVNRHGYYADRAFRARLCLFREPAE
jgi:peptidoglycan/xylan/chitin deacetylase (PgdA/CDA1 family)